MSPRTFRAVRKSRPFRRSLRVRIIAWSFVPTAIILFGVALVSFFAYRGVTEDLVVQRNRELTRLSAGQLTGGLTTFTSVLESIARLPQIVDSAPGGRREALAQAGDKQAFFDGGILVLDTRGEVVAARPERPDVLGADWADRAYFRTMLRSPGPVLSDVLEDGRAGAKVVIIGVPIITGAGEFRGAVLGLFRVGPTAGSSLYGEIVKLRVGGGGGFYVFDSAGVVIYNADLQRAGMYLGADPLVRRILSEGTGAVRTHDFDGHEVVAGFAPVPGTPWSLLALDDWSTLMAPSRTYRVFLYALLGLGLVVPALVVTLGSRRLTRPISDLSGAAQEVASGSFGRTIEVSSGDEIEELALQFNRMSVQLRDTYAELERRVEDRTRELATLNAIAAAASGSLDAAKVLEDALTETREALQMDIGVAFLLGRQGRELAMVAHEGMSGDLQRAVEGIGLAEWSRWYGGPLREPVAQLVEEHPPGRVAEALSAAGIALAITVPLVARGNMLGVLGLGSFTVRAVSQEELDLLLTIGNQVGVAAENARLYARAEETATAAERSRLARDLHDAVSQTLFSASLIAEVLPRLYEKDRVQGELRLAELRELTRGALAEMRALLLELRPIALQEAEIEDLLRQLTEAVTGRARVASTLVVEGRCSLPVDVKVVFYRIAQEALNNVIKHAVASRVGVRLECSGTGARLQIDDDGRGFDPAVLSPDSLGIGIMRERAEAVGAILDLRSETGAGTTVAVVWSSQEAHGPST